MHAITNNGWIEVVTGSMLSGKTEVRRLQRAEVAGQEVAAFTPAVGGEESSEARCRNCHTLRRG